jgi:hypothetical protein
MWPKDDFTEAGLRYRDTSLQFFWICAVLMCLLVVMVAYLSRIGVF